MSLPSQAPNTSESRPPRGSVQAQHETFAGKPSHGAARGRLKPPRSDNGGYVTKLAVNLPAASQRLCSFSLARLIICKEAR